MYVLEISNIATQAVNNFWKFASYLRSYREFKGFTNKLFLNSVESNYYVFLIKTIIYILKLNITLIIIEYIIFVHIGEAQQRLKIQAEMSLKCIAARVIKTYNLPYLKKVPRSLERFIELHGPILHST